MGNRICNCQHQAYNDDKETEVEPRVILFKFDIIQKLREVKSLEELKLTASDFIAFHKGRFLDYYEIGQILGEGAYGQVYECTNKQTKAKRAVKAMLKTGFYNEEERERFQTEVSLLKHMDHPNILKLYEVFQDDARYYVVTEICQGGELFDEIIKRKFFSEKDAADIMTQSLKAIIYCHSNDICHRDLKPENILIESKGSVKVIDFGTAMTFNPQVGMNTMIGTPYYMAPEILKSQRYDEKCDVWSLGVILYCLLTGKPPFGGENDSQIFQSVIKGAYSIKVLADRSVSQEAQDLISKMLILDPNERISAKDAIQHDWFHKESNTKSVDLNHTRESLRNLATFSADQKMQQAVLTYIVTQLVTNEEIQSTREIFQELDTNNDGKLSRDELIVGYKKIYGEFAEEQVDKILRLADIDGSGEIDYSEWLIATINRKNLVSEDKIKHAFSFFDKDGSGSISVEELKEVLGVKNRLVDDIVWNQLIQEVDTDGNGEIDYDEFKYMMNKLIDGEIQRRFTKARSPSPDIRAPSV